MTIKRQFYWWNGEGNNLRQEKGTCICVENYSYYPFKHGIRSTIAKSTYKKGDIYQFEYKPDDEGRWLYYLYREGESRLCNWSFFDDFFKIIGTSEAEDSGE